ncbi:hypothetical protein HK096_010792, partial [Nowakowskiella sp. JEL0078]
SVTSTSCETCLLRLLIEIELNESDDDALEQLKLINDSMTDSTSTSTKILGMMSIAAEYAFKKGNRKILKEVLRNLLKLNWNENEKDAAPSAVFHSSIILLVRYFPSFSDIITLFQQGLKALTEWKKAFSETDSENSLTGFQKKQFVNEACWMYETAWNLAVKSMSEEHKETEENTISSANIRETRVIQFLSLVQETLKLVDDEVSEVYDLKRTWFSHFIRSHCYLLQVRRYFANRINNNAPINLEIIELLKNSATEINALEILKQQSSKTNTDIDTIMSDKDLTIVNNSNLDSISLQSIPLEFEIKLRLEMWNDAINVVERSEKQETTVEIFQRLCGWSFLSFFKKSDLAAKIPCPSTVQFITFRTALDVMLKQDSNFDLILFSQWFRILITTCIVSNKHAALDLFKQALAIIQNEGGLSSNYPSCEITWLVVTCWNTGCDETGLLIREIGTKLSDDWPLVVLYALAFEIAQKKKEKTDSQILEDYIQFMKIISNLGLEKGKDVCSILKIKPSPKIGEILQSLIEWQLENPNASKELAENWLLQNYSNK